MRKNLNSYPVWTAMITPMHQDSTVHFQELEKLIRIQNEIGNGITLLGSTGEAINLDLEERKQIVDFALKLDNIDVPFMVGVGGNNLRDQKSWMEYLHRFNLQAYLIVVPYYSKPGSNGQYQWFKELMDFSEKPVCLYNAPGRSGKALDIDALKQLRDHKNFWALKESSGSEKDFQIYANAVPELHLLSGDDAMLPFFCKHGAKGVVSVASNIWPKETAAYTHQCFTGNIEEKELWDLAFHSLFVSSNPIPVKAIMAAEEIISNPTLRLPLHSHDMKNLKEAIKISQKIREKIRI